MMEITQSKPLSMVILKDLTRLFAETKKEYLTMYVKNSKDYPYLEIQGQMVSTVTGNIRTIRDSTDAEYYEFFILDKLPFEVMEKMHSSLTKINENNTKVSLLSLFNHQRRIEDELRMEKSVLTPEEKENRRYNVMRMNDILVKK